MFGLNGWEALLVALALAAVSFVVGGLVVLLRRSADTRRATPTSRPCVRTSVRRCATSPSCATTPSATWAAG